MLLHDLDDRILCKWSIDCEAIAQYLLFMSFGAPVKKAKWQIRRRMEPIVRWPSVKVYIEKDCKVWTFVVAMAQCQHNENDGLTIM